MLESRNFLMVLTDKEKAISLISNAIASYSLFSSQGSLPENITLIDFVLKAAPKDLRSLITMELIDEVYEYVSKARLDDS